MLLIQQSNILKFNAFWFSFLLPIWNKLTKLDCVFLKLMGKLRAGEIRRQLWKSGSDWTGMAVAQQEGYTSQWTTCPWDKRLLEWGPVHLLKLVSDGKWTEKCPVERKIMFSQKIWWDDGKCPWGSPWTLTFLFSVIPVSCGELVHQAGSSMLSAVGLADILPLTSSVLRTLHQSGFHSWLSLSTPWIEN